VSFSRILAAALWALAALPIIAASSSGARVLPMAAGPFLAPPLSRDRDEGGRLSSESTSAKGLLYVAHATNPGGEVAIYKQEGSAQRPIGRIKDGVDGPFGLFVDRKRNLYVANVVNGTVTVYSPGTTSPSLTLTGAGAPYDVVVGRDGTVYVANIGDLDNPSDGSGSVLAYPPGQTTPSKTIVAFKKVGEFPTAVALDSSDNLYVVFHRPYDSARPNKPLGEILEFSQGSMTKKNLGIHIASPLGLTIDTSNNLLVIDQSGPSVEVFPAGSSTPSKVISIPVSAAFVALNHSNDEIWVTGGFYSIVHEMSYPAGQLTDTIAKKAAYFVTGVATSLDGSS
jgi:hypothetical protein